jgi:hypothetical protein
MKWEIGRVWGRKVAVDSLIKILNRLGAWIMKL